MDGYGKVFALARQGGRMNYLEKAKETQEKAISSRTQGGANYYANRAQTYALLAIAEELQRLNSEKYIEYFEKGFKVAQEKEESA